MAIKHSSPLVRDLLTENRYWTFWSTDYKLQVNVFWKGKTEWKTVVEAVRKKMLKLVGEEILYERQVELKTPDLTLE